MIQKLQSFFKHLAQPYGLLIASLMVVILLTALTGVGHYKQELRHSISYPTQQSGGPSKPAQDIQQKGTSAESSAGSRVSVRSAPKTSTDAQPSAQKSQSASLVLPSTSLEVSLSVNGTHKGSVRLPSNSNHCDVLAEALRQGVISNLDLRYSTEYKTYAVYVINDVGDAGSIWWAYTVNGKSPPFGCSGSPAHDGDVVNWQYVKQ